MSAGRNSQTVSRRSPDRTQNKIGLRYRTWTRSAAVLFCVGKKPLRCALFPHAVRKDAWERAAPAGLRFLWRKRRERAPGGCGPLDPRWAKVLAPARRILRLYAKKRSWFYDLRRANPDLALFRIRCWDKTILDFLGLRKAIRGYLLWVPAAQSVGGSPQEPGAVWAAGQSKATEHHPFHSAPTREGGLGGGTSSPERGSRGQRPMVLFRLGFLQRKPRPPRQRAPGGCRPPLAPSPGGVRAIYEDFQFIF